MLRYLFLPLLMISSAWTALAQPGTTTEAEMELQGLFIEGNREKLLGNWDQAIAKFEEVLEQDRDNAAAAYELARVYEAKKDLERAEHYAEKAVDWDKENTWFRIYLADVYQTLNKDGDAASIYEDLVKRDPQNSDFYFKWAYYLVRNSEPEKAIDVYNNLENLIGINEEVTRHKHTLFLGMGKTREAAGELEQLIDKFPDNINYMHLLGTFYEQVDEKTKAKEIYERILEINPDDARARIALANDVRGSDDIRFLHSLKPVFEDPNTDVDTKIKEILPYVNQLAVNQDKNLGNTLLALTSLLTTLHDQSAKAHAVAGDVLYYTGQTGRALEQYKRTLELDDSVWLVWEQLLYIYADNKDFDSLIKSSEEALDIFPNQAVAYYLNGAGYNGTGDYENALSSLQQALIMSARNPRLRYEVLNESGKSYFHLKQYAKSDNAFEEALKIKNDDPLILKNYSYYLALRGKDLQKAKEFALRLNKVAPDHPVSKSTLAFVYYKMKEYNTAREWYEDALQHGGAKDALILENYGDVLFKLGEQTMAVEYWQKALEQGGDSEMLEKKVKEGKMIE